MAMATLLRTEVFVLSFSLLSRYEDSVLHGLDAYGLRWGLNGNKFDWAGLCMVPLY